ncbi:MULTISPECIES: mannose/fructose/sorbose PTS transporter subunit IIB [unclassified Brenneria]|uniref:PTS system mannose/fructose/N-acetylgalactosamine-transporter subunit IIB n=1 Tax=unclassified Brenneria TaxID=2634434 RepID=UPI0029C1661C|nr:MULTISPECIES: mannose/fructose/sorbose PTS transporter subunit IIB [unclassified Brenneria]MDX5628948.1 mannose/fructose/sorbose PTS transporter subunit IIB [Brenneria sp. L3-3Z]MDX5696087.1 mannose/fructose/sorbose PTS transporter subunit IIB [Brenneria sp. L4-2C]
MIIKLARIDDRLIHGQVTTVWAKEAKAERIMICNDDVYHDELRKTLLKQAAPPGIKVNVVNIEKAVAVYHNEKYANDTVFYLFTNPNDVLRMVNAGVKIKKINIGGMAYRIGKTQLTKAVSLDKQDVDAFQQLASAGVELDLRVVISDPPIDFINKINAVEFS